MKKKYINAITYYSLLQVSKVLFIILIHLFVLASHGQSIEKKGKIISTQTSVPIELASVLIIDPAKDSLIIDYTQTGQDGSFKFIIDENTSDRYLIKVLRLGYKETIVKLISNDQIQIIRIEPKDIELQEVTITTKRPIRIKKDTTAYNLKSFSDGTERNLEEVLKKLPGIQVSDKGIITFNGKSITKILVEGDDFFSDDYQILSKNITPNIVEGIEAIENFNDNKLLRGVKKSDQVILNLNLDKKLKVSLFGNITGGGGIENRYTSNAVLFSFIKKLKVGYIGNINNVGERSINELNNNFGEPDQVSTSREIPAFLKSNDQIINQSDVFIPNIERSRYIDNQSLLQALQTNLKVSSKINFKNYGYFYKDKFENTSSNITRFLGNENETSFTEQSVVTNDKELFFNKSSLSIEPDSLSVIQITTNFSRSTPNSSNTVLNVFSDQSSDQAFSNNNDELTINEYDIEFARKISTSSVIQIYGHHTNENLNQELLLSGGRFFNLFNQNNPQQELNLSQKTTYLGVNYIKNIKKHNLEFDLNYSSNRSSLVTGFTGSQPEVSFLNDLSFSQNNLRFKVSHRYSFNEQISLNTKIFLNKLDISSVDNLTASEIILDDFFLESKVNLQYRNNKGHRFNLSGSILNNVSGITDLFSNNIITDLRNVENRINEINLSKDLRIDFRYTYFNRKNFHRFTLGSNYSHIQFPYIFSLETTDLLNIIQRRPSGLGVNNGSVFTDTNKLIYKIKSRVGLRGQFSYSEFGRIINNDNTNQRTFNYSIGAYLFTAFKGWINFKTEVDYTQIIVPENTISQRFTTDKLNLNISGIIKPSKSIDARLAFQRIQLPNLNSNFLDFYLTFKPEKYPKFSGRFVVRNILDTNSLAFDNFSTSVIQQNQFNIVPRIIYVALTWNLGI
ncbi:hypothetical protein GTQ40_04610 [Flavobacteriaceae bacterium R38]|nr:hypothetical protein [Flavobacteriaceae bacterium R38]